MQIQNTQVTQMPTKAGNNNGVPQGDAHKESPTEATIQAWLVSYLAELLEIDPDSVDVKIPFNRYGLDSLAAVGLTGDLEDWLGLELEPTLLYDYPTIEALAEHLAENS